MREREKKKERKRGGAPYEGWSPKPKCSDRELNQQSFSAQGDTQSTEPHQRGVKNNF